MTLFYLVTRNLLRRPLRLALTVLPMCLAFVGFSIIIGIDNAYDVEYELDEKKRVVTINRQSIVQPLNESSVARIRDLPCRGCRPSTSSGRTVYPYQAESISCEAHR